MHVINCPNCQSQNTCRIVYGMPVFDEELRKKLDSGKIHLGGCEIIENSPDRHCNDCKANFGTEDPDIYLDIDGVLLTSDLKPANYASEFIQTIVERYPYTTYWLTTHCDGDASTSINNIGHLFEKETVELMRMIKPTSWQTAKTRGINFDRPFLWFDDNLFYEEKETLQKNGDLDSWIEVNLKKDPDQLAKFIDDFPAQFSD